MTNNWVVHCKKDEYDVYIGRGSKWGNPFKMNDKSDEERNRVIEEYKQWLSRDEQKELLNACKTELKGKILGCWCSPKACHGSVLAEIANNTD